MSPCWIIYVQQGTSPVPLDCWLSAYSRWDGWWSGWSTNSFSWTSIYEGDLPTAVNDGTNRRTIAGIYFTPATWVYATGIRLAKQGPTRIQTLEYRISSIPGATWKLTWRDKGHKIFRRSRENTRKPEYLHYRSWSFMVLQWKCHFKASRDLNKHSQRINREFTTNWGSHLFELSYWN